MANVKLETIVGDLAEITAAPPDYNAFSVRLLPPADTAFHYHLVHVHNGIWADGKQVDGPGLLRWLADMTGKRPSVALHGHFGDYPGVEKAEFSVPVYEGQPDNIGSQRPEKP